MGGGEGRLYVVRPKLAPPSPAPLAASPPNHPRRDGGAALSQLTERHDGESEEEGGGAGHVDMFFLLVGGVVGSRITFSRQPIRYNEPTRLRMKTHSVGAVGGQLNTWGGGRVRE